MIDLKQRLQSNTAILIALACWTIPVRADVAAGGDYTLTKVLIGASGISEQQGGDYDCAAAFGEPISGQSAADDNAIDTVLSGYFGGHAANGKTFNLISTWIDGLSLTQDGVRIAVPLNAAIHLSFSEPVNVATLYDGLSLPVIMDHLGQNQSALAPIQFSADITGSTITITPQTAWDGNTLYNVVASAGLEGSDGATLATTNPVPFLTLLDPHQDNLVITPVAGGTSLGAGAPTDNPQKPPMNIHVPPQALSDYAALLVNYNPSQTSLTAIQTANSRAQSTYGAYATPLMLTQVTAINAQGAPLSTLSQPAELALAYNAVQLQSAAYIRPGSLSLWALDTTHDIWVKIPSSQLSASAVSATVSQFAVFALMGQASGSASDVYVFPDPWRPHGPNAGTAQGQTGTDASGMTFTNLPSECTIKIYSLSGGLVHEIHHSDTATPVMGEETWDGHTTHGELTASGVYLWRVESSVDGKNGKLMIIR